MQRQEVFERVAAIFIDIIGDPGKEIEESTCTSDIPEWDSLKHISILEAVQSEFDISLSLTEMIEIKSVADIISAVLRKKGC